jgi:hypothetical protein
VGVIRIALIEKKFPDVGNGGLLNPFYVQHVSIENPSKPHKKTLKLTLINNSKCAVLGPEAGSGSVWKIDAFEGRRIHPTLLNVPLAKTPERESDHKARSTAVAVSFRVNASKVSVESVVHWLMTAG